MQPSPGETSLCPRGAGRGSIQQRCPAWELHPCWEAAYGTHSTHRYWSPSFVLYWGQAVASSSQCSWVCSIFHIVSVKSWNIWESNKESLTAHLDNPDIRKEPRKHVLLQWGGFESRLQQGSQRVTLLWTVAFCLTRGRIQSRPTAFLRSYGV